MVGVTGNPVTVRRRAAYTGLVLVAAAAAWAWVLLGRGAMGAATGTMGLDPLTFVGMWTVMMAAMMLPATAPVASLYARTVTVHRTPRMIAFTAGYVLVWAAAGLPAYALAAGAARAANAHVATGTAVAAAVFAINGVYQFTPLKNRCLATCRSPIGLLLRYASYRGPYRDGRAGAHHGAFCLGCCWSLMLLFAAFGVMNVWAMVGLAAVVAVEKLAPKGPLIGRLFGIASIAMALAVFWMPALAPGLTGGDMGGMSGA